MSTQLIEAIYSSSDFSTSDANCIAAIQGDLDSALGPIADALHDHPEEQRLLRSVFADQTLAAKIHHDIWPNNLKDTIAGNLSMALEPVAKELEKKSDPSAMNIRELYRYEGDDEYARAIKVDPCARPLSERIRASRTSPWNL